MFCPLSPRTEALVPDSRVPVETFANPPGVPPLNNHVAVRRVARRFILSDFGKRDHVAGRQILLHELKVTAGTNNVGDLVVFRTYCRANSIGIAEANAFSRTACNRLSVNLRIAAAVACEVNIFAVRRECGLCINTAARRELSEILSVGIQQIYLLHKRPRRQSADLQKAGCRRFC